MGEKIDLSNLIYKGLDLITEEVNEDERAVIFRITTPKKDIIGDIVETKGADLSYYRKHSVFLWAHDHTIPTLGRAMWIKKDPDNMDIKIKVQFQDTTQFAKEIYELYKTKYLRGCSIGFRVKPGGMETIEGDDKARGGTRFTKWMLIEVSGCNCPAHPDAIAVAKSIVTTDRLKRELGFDEDEEKAIGGKRDLPLAPEDRKWDATRAERSVRNWAGKEKEKIDWKKYQQAFIWYDPKDRENFRAYKLPFAEVIDGSLKAVWRGIASGMAVLMGARGGIDIPDKERKPVYNFLVSYYKKFDKEPPEFREYTDEEIEDLIAEYELEEDEFNPIDYSERTATFKYCICKKCGYWESKKAGDPCQEKKCPKCKEPLMGSNEKPKKSSDEENIEKPYPNEHSCRLKDPDKYDRFARKNCARKSDGKCIDHIYGIKEGKSEIQALRYKKDIWTEGDAKTHCKGEKGFFEPATGKSEGNIDNEQGVKEVIKKLFVEVVATDLKEFKEMITEMDARMKKMEEPKKSEKDIIEVIDDKKKGVKEKTEDKPAIKETFTLKEAREIAEKAVKMVIDGALDYHLGKSFVVKR